MSKDKADKTHGMNPELVDIIDRIASIQADDDSVEKLIAKVNDSIESVGQVSETPQPLERNGYAKENSMGVLSSTVTAASSTASSVAANTATGGLPNRGRMGLWKWVTVVAATVAFVAMLGNWSSPGTTVFAAMQTALKKAKTIQCSSVLYRPGETKAWKKSKTFIEEPNWARDEVWADGMGDSVNVFNLETKRLAAWSPATKMAVVGNISDVDQIRKLTNTFIDILRNADAETAVQVERYEEDDKWFVVYEYTAEITEVYSTKVRVVLDEASTLPVEVKFLGDDGEVQRKIDGFIFDADIDPAMFSTEAPEGYSVREMDQ